MHSLIELEPPRIKPLGKIIIRSPSPGWAVVVKFQSKAEMVRVQKNGTVILNTPTSLYYRRTNFGSE